MPDVRINQITSNVNVTDASAMLTPVMLERIVQAVIARIEERKHDEHEAEQERSMGAGLRQDVRDRL